jgi:hypothetical protein
MTFHKVALWFINPEEVMFTEANQGVDKLVSIEMKSSIVLLNDTF